jgi:hypothetical protein
LIEAKAKVNEALPNIKRDEFLKYRLSITMDAYADAGTIWGAKIKHGRWLLRRRRFHRRCSGIDGTRRPENDDGIQENATADERKRFTSASASMTRSLKMK